MKLWQRRLFGILAISGGALGVTVTTTTLFQTHRVVEWIIYIVFSCVFAWGAWCGVKLLEAQPGAERANLWFWLIQVPFLTSPVVAYSLTSGFHFTLSLDLPSFVLGMNFWLGSTFNFSLLQSDQPFSIGANVFALAVFLWLGKLSRAQSVAVSSPP